MSRLALIVAILSPMTPDGGSHLPAWGKAELAAPPPRYGRAGLLALLGPGLVMVGANIGGGEWLFGPVVTARYGGMLHVACHAEHRLPSLL